MQYATKADIERVLERMDSFASRILERIDAVKLELIERDEAVTKLLKEFRKWALSLESRFKAKEALVVGFSERMSSPEERVSDPERRD